MILLSVMFAITAWSADFSDCSQNFYTHQPPDYIDPKLIYNSVPLCFNGFATLYSGVSRTPLWSAEHLTRERLYLADEIPREDSFHSEGRLPQRMRSELTDYRSSGYDRGHLAPNADMANQSQQYDSFSLANIAPQHPELNRYIWKELESVTRYFTKKYGEVYVITGVAFRGDKLSQINNRVLVPSHLFKAIYIPKTGKASAYFAPNDDTKRVEVISIDDLALLSGVDVFPGISGEAKSEVIELPTMVGDITNGSKQSEAKDNNINQPLWSLIFVEVLDWVINNFISK